MLRQKACCPGLQLDPNASKILHNKIPNAQTNKSNSAMAGLALVYELGHLRVELFHADRHIQFIKRIL